MAQYDYDCIVIGGGSAGLTGSGISANFGAKTMMIERDRLGGDCTWTGCIPSKTLLKSARVVRQIREGSRYGLKDQQPDFDFAEIMKHVRGTIEEVYEDADRPEIFEDMGIDVVFGDAAFTDPHTIAVQGKEGDRRISSKYFLIATGASAFVPPIEGLSKTPYLTNHSLFELQEQPEHLIIIGAGPIGCEMAQAFRSLGSEVTVLEAAGSILQNDDPEVSVILKEKLEEQGITFVFNADISRISHGEGGFQVDMAEQDGISGDQLLVATGRRANVHGLGLENAGVRFSEKGIEVDDSCRSNVSHIYAAGDVTGRYQLTHMSEHMAKTAVTKALLKVPMKLDQDHVPWVTFTDPEVAQVGATESQLKEKGAKFEVYRFPYSKVDRALAENESEGLIKVMGTKWTGKILGVSVAGAHAGEIISEYAVAMKNGVSMRNIADTIHPYPSWALGARRAADQWYIRNQSEWSVKWIKRIFGYRGAIPDLSDPDRIV